jgi:predicted protein tyrosine phosphatase
MAYVLAQSPFNYNTRSAGTNRSYALNLIDENLILWADEIVCADEEHKMELITYCTIANINLKQLRKNVVVLGIPDIYDYRDPTLIAIIKKNYSNYLKEQR